MYYRIKSDIYYDYGISAEPELPGNSSFLRGALIPEQITTPMVFLSDFTRENPPKPFAGLSIPLWSDDLLGLFQSVGVDNLQYFQATIKGEDESIEWANYHAVNVIGLVDAADMAKSQYTAIGSAPSGATFAGFHKLVLDGKRAHDFALFRLAENPGTLLAHERVINAIKANPRSGGWGITAVPVDEG